MRRDAKRDMRFNYRVFLQQLVIGPNRLLCIRACVRANKNCEIWQWERNGKEGERTEGLIGLMDVFGCAISDFGRKAGGGWMPDVL